MSYPEFQLEEFFVQRMRIDWHEPPGTVTTNLAFSFDYDVATHKTEKNRYRLVFRVAAKSNTPEPVGYEIDCEIAGFFTFNDGLDKQKMAKLIRLNGCTMLYGILRGQIAGITGTFPGRKFILPAFMMQDVVQEIEKAKIAKRKPAADAPIKTAQALPESPKKAAAHLAKK